MRPFSNQTCHALEDISVIILKYVAMETATDAYTWDSFVKQRFGQMFRITKG